MSLFDKKKILAAARSVLRLNPSIRKDINENFSRTKTSFYPTLAFKFFGEDMDNENMFLKAMNLHNFIKRDSVFLNEIANINTNSDSNCFSTSEDDDDEKKMDKAFFISLNRCEDPVVIGKTKEKVIFPIQLIKKHL